MKKKNFFGKHLFLWGKKPEFSKMDFFLNQELSYWNFSELEAKQKVLCGF